MSKVSNNIKMLRRRFSLTQEQLGAIAGVSDKAVSTWENGVAEPRMGAVRKMSEYFGISIAEIIDSDEPVKAGRGLAESLYGSELADNPAYREAIDIMLKNPQLVDLVCELGSVNKEDMVLIESLIKKLAGKKHR